MFLSNLSHLHKYVYIIDEKFKIWPFFWPLTPKKGSDEGVNMNTFDPLKSGKV